MDKASSEWSQVLPAYSNVWTVRMDVLASEDALVASVIPEGRTDVLPIENARVARAFLNSRMDVRWQINHQIRPALGS